MNGTICIPRGRALLAWVAASCALVAISLLWSGVAYADQAVATAENAADVPSLDPALMDQWVGELDDDRYAVREAAQKRLAAAGSPALEKVAQVAATGSLESSTRAVSVLVGWADSEDNKFSLAALEHIAALANRPTEAGMALERLADVREAAAIESIKGLGGRFDYDRSLGMVGGMSAPLQIIIGPQWKGDVDGLKHVAAVRSARTLSLHSAPLDDAALATLAQCIQLQRIEVYGTAVSAEAVAKLQPRMPNTVFDIRGGARLGIRGLIIEQIVVDSPAEKAGLARNDRVTEFAGQPIETFEQLTQQIAKCKPGDTVTVKVLRGTETLEKKVTFDRWGDDERSTMPTPEAQQGFVPVQIQGGGRIIIQPGGQIIPVDPIPEQRR